MSEKPVDPQVRPSEHSFPSQLLDSNFAVWCLRVWPTSNTFHASGLKPFCQDHTICRRLSSLGSRLRDGDLHAGRLLGSTLGNKSCPVGGVREAGLDRGNSHNRGLALPVGSSAARLGLQACPSLAGGGGGAGGLNFCTHTSNSH